MGAIMQKWTPAQNGRDFEDEPDPRAARAVPESAHGVPATSATGPARAARVHALVPATVALVFHPQGEEGPREPHMAATADQLAAQQIGQEDDGTVSFTRNRNRSGPRRRQRCENACMKLQRLGRRLSFRNVSDAAAGGEQSAPAVPAPLRPGRLAAETRSSSRSRPAAFST